MIGCLRTFVRKQPIVTLDFEFEILLNFYNLKARYFYTLRTIVSDIHVAYYFGQWTE